MPKGIVYAGLVLLILAMIPPAVIARTRAVHSAQRRIHFIQDMDNQGKFRAQAPAPHLFADGRAMRPPVAGTVARGKLLDDRRYTMGVTTDDDGQPQWITSFPDQITVDMQFMQRGQERFGIYCTPCHGIAGYGDGMIDKRAWEAVNQGLNGTIWVQPKSLHEPLIREQPPGQIFNTITHGIRNMAGYESQVPLEDRWAIVAYVKALQRSQHANIQDVPEDLRDDLPVIDLPAEAREALQEATPQP